MDVTDIDPAVRLSSRIVDQLVRVRKILAENDRNIRLGEAFSFIFNRECEKFKQAQPQVDSAASTLDRLTLPLSFTIPPSGVVDMVVEYASDRRLRDIIEKCKMGSSAEKSVDDKDSSTNSEERQNFAKRPLITIKDPNDATAMLKSLTKKCPCPYFTQALMEVGYEHIKHYTKHSGTFGLQTSPIKPKEVIAIVDLESVSSVAANEAEAESSRKDVKTDEPPIKKRRRSHSPSSCVISAAAEVSPTCSSNNAPAEALVADQSSATTCDIPATNPSPTATSEKNEDEPQADASKEAEPNLVQTLNRSEQSAQADQLAEPIVEKAKSPMSTSNEEIVKETEPISITGQSGKQQIDKSTTEPILLERQTEPILMTNGGQSDTKEKSVKISTEPIIIDEIREPAHSFKWHKCPMRFCRFVSDTLIGLEKHKGAPHKLGNQWICGMCEPKSKMRMHRTLLSYFEHIHKFHSWALENEISHHTWTCVFCFRTFRSDYTLNSHIKRCEISFLVAKGRMKENAYDSNQPYADDQDILNRCLWPEQIRSIAKPMMGGQQQSVRPIVPPARIGQSSTSGIVVNRGVAISAAATPTNDANSAATTAAAAGVTARAWLSNDTPPVLSKEADFPRLIPSTGAEKSSCQLLPGTLNSSSSFLYDHFNLQPATSLASSYHQQKFAEYERRQPVNVFSVTTKTGAAKPSVRKSVNDIVNFVSTKANSIQLSVKPTTFANVNNNNFKTIRQISLPAGGPHVKYVATTAAGPPTVHSSVASLLQAATIDPSKFAAQSSSFPTIMPKPVFPSPAMALAANANNFLQTSATTNLPNSVIFLRNPLTGQMCSLIRPSAPQMAQNFSSTSSNNNNNNKLTTPSGVVNTKVSYEKPGGSTEHADAASKGSIRFHCELCDAPFALKATYIVHLRSNHQKLMTQNYTTLLESPPLVSCSCCMRRFFTYEGLERHLLMEHALVNSTMLAKANRREDGAKCKFCRKVFAFNILQHMAIEHKFKLRVANVVFTCDLCQKTFGQYQLLENHLKIDHKKFAGASTNAAALATIRQAKVQQSIPYTSSVKGPVSLKKLIANKTGKANNNNESNDSKLLQQQKAKPNIKVQRQLRQLKRSGVKFQSENAKRGLKSNNYSSSEFRKSNTSTSIPKSATPKKSVKFCCTPCKLKFDLYEDVLNHWAVRHLKKLHVPTCKIDQCKRCLTQFGVKDDADFSCQTVHVAPKRLKLNENKFTTRNTNNSNNDEAELICLE